ncbi:MAG: hypothetical protein GX488_01410, partial [Clostridiales bacterium]|nr:hypothetical protein [Clostridiales bacterium]
EDYADEIGSALKKYSVKVLACPVNPYIDTRLRSHIDLSVFHFGDNRFLLSCVLNKSRFAEKLAEMGADIIFPASTPGAKYPDDARLCALAVGKLLFHNLKITDQNILDGTFGRYICVGQGYAKCAVCLVSETAAITADNGLAKTMRAAGMDVLLISSGNIELKGFSEGFIGGASFKIAPDTLAFTGSLDSHPDKREIEEFLKKHEVNPLYLTSKPVFDIGSVIPLSETI